MVFTSQTVIDTCHFLNVKWTGYVNTAFHKPASIDTQQAEFVTINKLGGCTHTNMSRECFINTLVVARIIYCTMNNKYNVRGLYVKFHAASSGNPLINLGGYWNGRDSDCSSQDNGGCTEFTLEALMPFVQSLGAFEKLRKVTVSFVASVSLSLSLSQSVSLYPHGTTRLPLDRPSRNLIF
jgi:hypothetical protein